MISTPENVESKYLQGKSVIFIQRDDGPTECSVMGKLLPFNKVIFVTFDALFLENAKQSIIRQTITPSNDKNRPLLYTS